MNMKKKSRKSKKAMGKMMMPGMPKKLPKKVMDARAMNKMSSKDFAKKFVK